MSRPKKPRKLHPPRVSWSPGALESCVESIGRNSKVHTSEDTVEEDARTYAAESPAESQHDGFKSPHNAPNGRVCVLPCSLSTADAWRAVQVGLCESWPLALLSNRHLHLPPLREPKLVLAPGISMASRNEKSLFNHQEQPCSLSRCRSLAAGLVTVAAGSSLSTAWEGCTRTAHGSRRPKASL